MRTALAVTAVAGTLCAALGVLYSLATLALVGFAVVVVALVMGALVAPSSRGRR